MMLFEGRSLAWSYNMGNSQKRHSTTSFRKPRSPLFLLTFAVRKPFTMTVKNEDRKTFLQTFACAVYQYCDNVIRE
jgi:hypothetical protein